MRKETDAIKKLCDYKSKVSSHYFIKNSGETNTLTNIEHIILNYYDTRNTNTFIIYK